VKNCLSPVAVYHYKIEISSDGKEWTVVGDLTQNDRISVFPEPVDWDGDGRSSC
jgi:hypothetical protein